MNISFARICLAMSMMIGYNGDNDLEWEMYRLRTLDAGRLKGGGESANMAAN